MVVHARFVDNGDSVAQTEIVLDSPPMLLIPYVAERNRPLFLLPGLSSWRRSRTMVSRVIPIPFVGYADSALPFSVHKAGILADNVMAPRFPSPDPVEQRIR